MQNNMHNLRKTHLILVFLFFSLSNISGITYYVSPNGTSNGTGTIDSPLLFVTALNKSLTAGDSIILRGGTYSYASYLQFSKNGTSTDFIHIVNYPGETPVFDFRYEAYNGSNQGIRVSGSYLHIKGLIVQGAGDNGMQVTGSNNKIENCTFRWNCDSGLQMKTGSNNLILNCDSYENFDYKTGGTSSPDYGGNADGFADKQYENTGTNTYEGCRSWRNSDDGWDSYQKAGNTVYKNSWCFDMGPSSYDMTDNIRFKTDSASWFYQFKSSEGRYVITNYGNGNGFKLGGNYTVNNATLTNCVSVNNTVKGFDQNNDAGAMVLYNCTSYKNKYNYGFSNSSYGTLVIKNSISLSGTNSNSFKTTSYTQSNNTWSNGFSVASSDFESLDISQLYNDRQADGSLPNITLLHIVEGSSLINAGVDVGLPYTGTAPDIGAFEYGTTSGLFSTKSSNQKISINPNPVNENSIIQLNSDITENIFLQIIDLSGRIVSQYQTLVTIGNNRLKLPANNLAKGTYFCKVVGKSIYSSQKIIK